MSSGTNRLYDRACGVARGAGAASAVSPRRNSQRGSDVGVSASAAAEIATLRTLNAHLVRQVALLKQREAQALRLADRDGLTGLYNRRRMLELLDTSIAEAARQRRQVGLLFIDLDGFKGVNDRYGHGVGDKLLVTVAARIAARARTADFVCRYGGDEFVVILPSVAEQYAVSRVAASIGARLALPYRIDGIELHMTAAIGQSLYPEDSESAAELMYRADESMYRAKAHPREADVRVTRPALPSRRRDDR